MSILEKRDVEDPVVRWAALQGVISLKLNVSGNVGWPDRVFFLPQGKAVFIEFKRPGGEPTERQKLVHRALQKLGYEVYVYDNKEVAIQTIQQALDTARLPEKSCEVSTRARRSRAVP